MLRAVVADVEFATTTEVYPDSDMPTCEVCESSADCLCIEAMLAFVQSSFCCFLAFYFLVIIYNNKNIVAMLHPCLVTILVITY